ncbi:hypothetical protein DFH09DRAFT_1326430 [Mycena vulgaris]|nr:hypothetical protein DFH09DRAFT_1326430 [Mycena vulgaris]
MAGKSAQASDWLQKKLRQYNRAKKRGHEETVKRRMREIPGLGEGHSDPEVHAEWIRKAEAFETASEEDKQNMLLDIGKGLGIIIVSPFLLAGGVLYGVGLFIIGLGDLTGGTIGRLGKLMQIVRYVVVAYPFDQDLQIRE